MNFKTYLAAAILAIAGSNVFAGTSPKEEIDCLAVNMYHEAAIEPMSGQLAVAQVVLNRVRDNRFPNTICEVVYDAQYSKWHKENTGKVVPLKNRCQFSWYCDGKPDVINKESKVWKDILALAFNIYYMEHYRYRIDNTNGATHYHADYVSPRWSKSKTRIVKIGRHIFYRWN